MIPSLFIAHGAPLLAIEDNEYTQFLEDLGRTLPRPKAIVMFSAHWVSPIQMVGQVDEYSTIYDFGGFPEALYRIQYPAKGSEQLAKEIEDLFSENGVSYEVDTSRGLDHGAWVVLRKLYPDADIPVISMSSVQTFHQKNNIKWVSLYRWLRDQDVLVIGSGGTVHNLPSC